MRLLRVGQALALLAILSTILALGQPAAANPPCAEQSTVATVTVLPGPDAP